MSPLFALFTFLVSWWVCLFIALPLSVGEGEKDDIAYNASPARFHWKKSLLIATLLAAMVTLALALAISSGEFHMDTLS